MKSQHIHKSHNKSLLLYHIVFPAKYRRKVFNKEVDKTLKLTCLEISDRYEINFVEIGNDEDHVHFLIQSVPMLSITKIVTTIKSITAREIFANHKEIKKILWGGALWSSGFYINTVGQYANEEMIIKYVKNQGKEYIQIHRGQLKIEFL
jgi:REP element-mobilizing transposase RayT